MRNSGKSIWTPRVINNKMAEYESIQLSCYCLLLLGYIGITGIWILGDTILPYRVYARDCNQYAYSYCYGCILCCTQQTRGLAAN